MYVQQVIPRALQICYTTSVVKSKKLLLILVAAIATLVLGLLIAILLHRGKTTNHGLSATVVSVINKPNQAEDGYYGIIAQDATGRKYTINATGYLNTPVSHDSRGQDCVGVPKVKVGDKVSFNLPKVENQTNADDTCYKKGLTGCYFMVE